MIFAPRAFIASRAWVLAQTKLDVAAQFYDRIERISVLAET